MSGAEVVILAARGVYKTVVRVRELVAQRRENISMAAELAQLTAFLDEKTAEITGMAARLSTSAQTALNYVAVVVRSQDDRLRQALEGRKFERFMSITDCATLLEDVQSSLHAAFTLGMLTATAQMALESHLEQQAANQQRAEEHRELRAMLQQLMSSQQRQQQPQQKQPPPSAPVQRQPDDSTHSMETLQQLSRGITSIAASSAPAAAAVQQQLSASLQAPASSGNNAVPMLGVLVPGGPAQPESRRVERAFGNEMLAALERAEQHAFSESQFVDPVTRELMSDPVLCSNGCTYDRWSAFEALDEGYHMPGCAGGAFAILGANMDLRAALYLAHPGQAAECAARRQRYIARTIEKVAEGKLRVAKVRLERALGWLQPSESQYRQLSCQLEYVLEELSGSSGQQGAPVSSCGPANARAHRSNSDEATTPAKSQSHQESQAPPRKPSLMSRCCPCFGGGDIMPEDPKLST